MLKRVLFFLLVFSLISGGTIGVSADTSVFSDINDNRIKEASERLYELKIVEGDSDNKFHPEGSLTRAQVIKMLIHALNLGDAAKQAEKFSPYFSDIPDDYWAKGYINLATTLYITKGNGSMEFFPEREISHAEAITLILRTLGYQDSMLGESWPDDFMIKAFELGLIETADIPGDVLIDRGTFALLLSKALDAHVIKAEENGNITVYTVDSRTLYEKSFGQ